MSNLKLPTLTYGALASSIRPAKAQTIAYATTAEHGHDGDGSPVVIIRHHGSRIATLGRGYVRIESAGYSTSTTTARLHRVLTDNSVGYGVAIRGGLIHVINMDAKRTKLADISDDRAYAAFYRDNGNAAWTIAMPGNVPTFDKAA